MPTFYLQCFFFFFFITFLLVKVHHSWIDRHPYSCTSISKHGTWNRPAIAAMARKIYFSNWDQVFRRDLRKKIIHQDSGKVISDILWCDFTFTRDFFFREVHFPMEQQPPVITLPFIWVLQKFWQKLQSLWDKELSSERWTWIAIHLQTT